MDREIDDEEVDPGQGRDWRAIEEVSHSAGCRRRREGAVMTFAWVTGWSMLSLAEAHRLGSFVGKLAYGGVVG